MPEQALQILHKTRQGHIALPVEGTPSGAPTPVTTPSLQTIHTNKDCYKFSFLPNTIKHWNKLPFNLTTIQDNKAFKTAALEPTK